MMKDLQAPPDMFDLATQAVTTRSPAHVNAALIPSLAYELAVMTADLPTIAKAYDLTLPELTHELRTNKHLKRAFKEVTEDIAQKGAFYVGVQMVAGQTLPHMLRDNINPLTDPSTRSRNMQILLRHMNDTERTGIAAVTAQDKGNVGAGMTVNFNVGSGIRGISDAVTITQE